MVLGLNITDPVPHFSTISKNYVRRFKDTNVFEEIFNEIVHQALKNNLIDAQEFFSDSTHIKANANKKKFNRGHVLKDARKYSREVLNEVNEIREEEGKNLSMIMIMVQKNTNKRLVQPTPIAVICIEKTNLKASST